jgi:hypothetical protein
MPHLMAALLATRRPRYLPCHAVVSLAHDRCDSVCQDKMTQLLTRGTSRSSGMPTVICVEL